MKGRNQLLMGMRGSFENLTVTRAADGDAVVSGKITQTTNPNTSEQQYTRSLFTQAVRVGRTLLAYIQSYYPASGALLSNFNQFIKNCMAYRDELSATITGLTESEIVEELLKRVSATTGRLYPLNVTIEDPAPFQIDEGNVRVPLAWAYDIDSPIQNGSDKIGAIIINSETLDYVINTNLETRSFSGAIVPVPVPSTGTNYMAIFAFDESKVRDGKYPLDAITSSEFVFSIDSADLRALRSTGWTEVAGV